MPPRSNHISRLKIVKNLVMSANSHTFVIIPRDFRQVYTKIYNTYEDEEVQSE